MQIYCDSLIDFLDFCEENNWFTEKQATTLYDLLPCLRILVVITMSLIKKNSFGFMMRLGFLIVFKK